MKSGVCEFLLRQPVCLRAGAGAGIGLGRGGGFDFKHQPGDGQAGDAQ